MVVYFCCVPCQKGKWQEREVNASSEVLALRAQCKGALSWHSAVTQTERQLCPLPAKAVCPDGLLCAGSHEAVPALRFHSTATTMAGKIPPVPELPLAHPSLWDCAQLRNLSHHGCNLQPLPLIEEENPTACGHTPCKAATSSLTSQPCSSRENYK